MTAERELVRVICQADRNGQTCRAIAARIVLANETLVLRFQRRSSQATSAFVAGIALNVEQKLDESAPDVVRDLAAAAGVDLKALPPKLRRQLIVAVVQELNRQAVVDPTAQLEPVIHRGLFTTTIELEVSTIDNWIPIGVQCPKCRADLRIDGDEATAAIGDPHARHLGKRVPAPKQIMGYHRIGPQR